MLSGKSLKFLKYFSLTFALQIFTACLSDSSFKLTLQMSIHVVF